MKKIFYLSFLLLLLMIPSNCFALNEVNIYFFHDNDCSICEQERVYLQALKTDRYPNMRIYSYEVNDSSNKQLMEQAKKMYGITKTGVPFTVIGDKAFIGFSQGMKGEFQHAVYTYSTQGYENKLGKQLNIGYSKELEGTVKEYKEKDNYVVEETSGIEHKTTEDYNKESEFEKYKTSIILVVAGVVLLVLYIVLKIRERRRYRQWKDYI